MCETADFFQIMLIQGLDACQGVLLQACPNFQ